MSLYNLLGVETSASSEEINSSYHQLVNQDLSHLPVYPHTELYKYITQLYPQLISSVNHPQLQVNITSVLGEIYRKKVISWSGDKYISQKISPPQLDNLYSRTSVVQPWVGNPVNPISVGEFLRQANPDITLTLPEITVPDFSLYKDIQLPSDQSLITDAQLREIPVLPKFTPINFSLIHISPSQQKELFTVFQAELSKDYQNYVGFTVPLPIQTPAPWISSEGCTQCSLCEGQFGFFIKRINCWLCGLVICSNCGKEKPAPVYGFKFPVPMCTNCDKSLNRIMSNLLVAEYQKGDTKLIKYLIVATFLGLPPESLLPLMDKLLLEKNYQALLEIGQNILTVKVILKLSDFIGQFITQRLYDIAYTFGLYLAPLMIKYQIQPPVPVCLSDYQLSIYRYIMSPKVYYPAEDISWVSSDFSYLPLNQENIKSALIHTVMHGKSPEDVYHYLLINYHYATLSVIKNYYRGNCSISDIFKELINLPPDGEISPHKASFLIYQLVNNPDTENCFNQMVKIYGSVVYYVYHHYIPLNCPLIIMDITDASTIYTMIDLTENVNLFFSEKQYLIVLKYLLNKNQYELISQYVEVLIIQKKYLTAAIYLYHLFIAGIYPCSTIETLLSITTATIDLQITLIYTQSDNFRFVDLLTKMINRHQYCNDLMEKRHREWLYLLTGKEDSRLLTLYNKSLLTILDTQDNKGLLQFLTQCPFYVTKAVASILLKERKKSSTWYLLQYYADRNTWYRLLDNFSDFSTISFLLTVEEKFGHLSVNRLLRGLIKSGSITIPSGSTFTTKLPFPPLSKLLGAEKINSGYEYLNLAAGSNLLSAVVGYLLSGAKYFGLLIPYHYHHYLLVREMIITILIFSQRLSPIVELYYNIQCFKLVNDARKKGYNDNQLNTVSDSLVTRINFLAARVPFFPLRELAGYDLIYQAQILDTCYSIFLDRQTDVIYTSIKLQGLVQGWYNSEKYSSSQLQKLIN